MPGRQGGGAARLSRTAARRGRCGAARAGALVLAALAGCGQKGPLVRRDAQPGSAVTIRGPAADAAPAANAAPAPGAPPTKSRSDEPDAPRQP